MEIQCCDEQQAFAVVALSPILLQVKVKTVHAVPIVNTDSNYARHLGHAEILCRLESVLSSCHKLLPSRHCVWACVPACVGCSLHTEPLSRH